MLQSKILRLVWCLGCLLAIVCFVNVADVSADPQKDYLVKNAKADGVVVTESGLQYRVIRKGNGRSPKASDTVNVHYKGMLIDGTKFDSSYDRGQSISFPLNGVIKGWIEGVQLMKEGAKYEFVIPAKLAYGQRGIQNVIPGGATLIFEVELLGIK